MHTSTTTYYTFKQCIRTVGGHYILLTALVSEIAPRDAIVLDKMMQLREQHLDVDDELTRIRRVVGDRWEDRCRWKQDQKYLHADNDDTTNTGSISGWYAVYVTCREFYERLIMC